MKNKDQMDAVVLVVYYPDADAYEQQPLGQMIDFEIGMWAARKTNFPKRWIIGAFDSQVEAAAHIAHLKSGPTSRHSQ